MGCRDRIGGSLASLFKSSGNSALERGKSLWAELVLRMLEGGSRARTLAAFHFGMVGVHACRLSGMLLAESSL